MRPRIMHGNSDPCIYGFEREISGDNTIYHRAMGSGKYIIETFRDGWKGYYSGDGRLRSFVGLDSYSTILPFLQKYHQVL